jgi:hypothetical protein
MCGQAIEFKKKHYKHKTKQEEVIGKWRDKIGQIPSRSDRRIGGPRLLFVLPSVYRNSSLRVITQH